MEDKQKSGEREGGVSGERLGRRGLEGEGGKQRVKFRTLSLLSIGYTWKGCVA